MPILIVCVVLAAGYALNRYMVHLGIEPLLELFDQHKLLTAFIILLAVLLSTVFLIPSFMFLTCSAGFLYGWPVATVIVSTGSIAGAVIAFLAARSSEYRPRIHSWINTKAPLHRFEDLLNHSNWEAILLIRLFPFFPNRVLHYVFGLVDLPFHRFLIPTWLGTIPIILVYTYLGSTLKHFTSVEDIRGSSLLQGFYLIAGFIVLVGALLFFRTRARR